MKKFYLIFFFFIFLLSLSYSQNERIAALGSSTIALKDFDLELNLYDFGKNIAGLSQDKTFDILFIRPKVNIFSGDYKRFFDYEKSNHYSLSFDGTKVLKEGTFRGYVIYEIEYRQNVNRALNRYPYMGVPFFLADTTVGDFVYNGPKVGFQYSFEFLKNLYMGFELNYQLVDGLKNIYSRAKSLWRNIDGSYSLAYYLSKDFSFGAKISRLDNKESIEAKSEDLFDAEIFNYRGDTYSFKRRSQTVEQTYREKSTSYSFQSIITPIENLKVGIKSDYENSTLKTQYPYGTLKEYEEGHSVFENISVNTKLHYSLSENLLIGLVGNLESSNSWSRISELSLMIWKWNLQNLNLGSGLSYRIKFLPLLFVCEATFGNIKSDSSKYIDNKYVNHNQGYYLLRTGFEYEPFNRIFLRSGYQYGYFGFDPERGGKKVTVNRISFGIGLYTFNSLELDFYIEYIATRNFYNSNKQFNSQMSVKLYNY